MAESESFERGLQVRREVLGPDYVNENLADADEFMMAFQRIVTEWAWGYAWSRPGLDRRTRSMLNLAILTALGRPEELGIYVKGALATGVSVDETARHAGHMDIVRESIDGAVGRYAGDTNIIDGYDWVAYRERVETGARKAEERAES